MINIYYYEYYWIDKSQYLPFKQGLVVKESFKNMDEEIGCLDSMSLKGQKIRSYRLGFKLKAVEFAENNSTNAAATKLGVDLRRIREWKSMKIELWETLLQKWIHERR